MTPSLSNHKLQIMSKAVQYSSDFNMNKKDLFHQGVLIFHESIRTFDPKLSSFNTWLYINLQFNLHTYCKTNEIDFAEYIDEECITTVFRNKNRKRVAFSNMMLDFSSDSREVVGIVLNQDNLPINIQKKTRLSQKTLRRYLFKVKKWPVKKINISFKEIKEALRNL